MMDARREVLGLEQRPKAKHGTQLCSVVFYLSESRTTYDSCPLSINTPKPILQLQSNLPLVSTTSVIYIHW